MADEQETISQAALEAVGNLLETGKIHGIGIIFEPDEQGWSVGYMRGMGGGNLASSYDLETAARAAERPLTVFNYDEFLGKAKLYFERASRRSEDPEESSLWLLLEGYSGNMVKRS